MRIEADKGKGRRRAIYLSVAWVVVLGLFWVFNSAVSDREGRTQFVLAVQKMRDVQSAISAHYAERKSWPADLRTLIPDPQDALPFRLALRDGTITLTFTASPLAGKTLVFVPRLVGGKPEWSCDSGTVDARYRFAPCRKPD